MYLLYVLFYERCSRISLHGTKRFTVGITIDELNLSRPFYAGIEGGHSQGACHPQWFIFVPN